MEMDIAEMDNDFPLTSDAIPEIKIPTPPRKVDKEGWIEGKVKPIGEEPFTVEEKALAHERFGGSVWGNIEDGYSRVLKAGGLELWDEATLIARTRVFQCALERARDSGN